MRNAALMLGLIGGLWAMIVGFFGFGYVELTQGEEYIGEALGEFRHPVVIQVASLLAPVLAIAGGAMARSLNKAAGVLLLASAAAMLLAFGFNVFTMFPVAMCGLGGVLALLARQPDTH